MKKLGRVVVLIGFVVGIAAHGAETLGVSGLIHSTVVSDLPPATLGMSASGRPGYPVTPPYQSHASSFLSEESQIVHESLGFPRSGAHSAASEARRVIQDRTWRVCYLAYSPTRIGRYIDGRYLWRGWNATPEFDCQHFVNTHYHAGGYRLSCACTP